MSNYYLRNKELILERQKAYYNLHRDRIREYNHNYYLKNRDMILEKHKRKMDHPKTQRERQREYYYRNKQNILDARKKDREKEAEARKIERERKAEARKKCVKTPKINRKPIEKDRFTVHLY